GSTRSTRTLTTIPRCVALASQPKRPSAPERTSTSAESVNQPLMCSGSVMTVQTTSIGASMSISRSMRSAGTVPPQLDLQLMVAHANTPICNQQLRIGTQLPFLASYLAASALAGSGFEFGLYCVGPSIGLM